MQTEQANRRPVLIVIGAGPGVSGSLARLHASRGYDVGLVGIDADALDLLTDDIQRLGSAAHSRVVDMTAPIEAGSEIHALAEHMGHVDTLHFNPSAFREKDPLELSVPELLEDVALGVGSLLTAVQAVRPYLAAGSRVTATGSMAADSPWSGAASLGVQKAGLRNLVQSLDDTLAKDGIRAVSVTVHGVLSTEGPFSPDRVAESLWMAARQEEQHWRSEVSHSSA